MRRACVMLLASAALMLIGNRAAMAFPQFLAEFKKQYINDHDDEEFKKAANNTKQRCFLCHQGAKSKKNRNSYGMQLDKLLSKDDRKDKEKIVEALKKVAKMHADPDDDTSETFGERIAAGKWPGGELEDLKVEPPKE